MVSTTQSQAMNAYKTVDVVGGATYADPHQLIKMLLDGAISRLALARGAIQRGKFAEKGQLIGSSITIIGGLQSCLDMDKGDAVSVNLDDLYDYMTRRLFHASANNDADAVEEVIGLLKEIKVAWDAIPQDVRDQFKVHLPESGDAKP